MTCHRDFGRSWDESRHKSHQRKSRMVAAAKLADVPVGGSPIGGDYPVGHRSYTRRWEGRPTHRKPGSTSLVTEASNSAGCSASAPVGSPETAHCWKCRARPPWVKTSVVGEGTGCRQPTDFPGSLRTTCREGTVSESSEPLVGRLGAPAQRRHRV